MREKSLSIIVPIYGVEEYILEFLESIVPQLLDSTELILINDGTKDKSMQICHSFLNGSYDNIVILEQSNQGQSVARNYGIQQAKGEYIGFLDPDDYVTSTYIEKLMLAIENYDTDIIDFCAETFSENDSNQKSIIMCQNLERGLYIEDKKYLKKVFLNNNWQSWLRIVKSNIIRKYKYPEGLLIQDAHIFPFIYSESKSIYHLDDILVYYRIRNNSSINQAGSRQLNSYKKVLEKYEFLYEDELYSILIEKFSINYLRMLYGINGIESIFCFLKEDFLNIRFRIRILCICVLKVLGEKYVK